MTPERLAKVRALAADTRGNAFVRAAAQRVLNAHAPKEKWTPPPDPPAPGIETDEAYDKFIFMDLSQWGQSAKGNYVHSMRWKGREYRFVLFQHKRTWGWLRADVKNDTESWGRNKYATLGEAHQSAWLHLTLI